MTKPSPQKYVARATTNRRLLNVLSQNCPEVAKTENIHQNYNVWKICREYNLHNVDKWYKHNLKTVEERNAITTLYDISIHTDREISASHLGIVINYNLNQDKKIHFHWFGYTLWQKYFHPGSRKIIEGSRSWLKIIRIWLMETEKNFSAQRCVRSDKKRSQETQ